MNYEQDIESTKRMLDNMAKDIQNVFDAPLKQGLMNAKEHAEFMQDVGKYSELISQNRTVEAESFREKLMKKYDKPQENGV